MSQTAEFSLSPGEGGKTGSFEDVAGRDDAYKKRGDTGQVYDDLFIRLAMAKVGADG